MACIFETYLLKVIYVTISIICLIALYFLYSYTYWLRRKIPYIQPVVPYGNFKSLFMNKKQLSEIGQDLYIDFKSKGCKFGGTYFLLSPVFIPIDPVLVKRIISTDFEYFSERGVHFLEKNDPLVAHLFSLPTESWKKLRVKLTPTFTSGKIKNMFDIIGKCGKELTETCALNAANPIEINDISMRYTVDIIGCCAFGIECNSLKDPNEKFKKIAERVICPPLWNGLKFFLSMMGGNIVHYANLTIMEKTVIQFFLDVVEQNVHYRETNNIRRNDFFQLLLDMKNKDETSMDNGDFKMTLKCMAAQCFVFFAAGFETSAMTMNFCLFELTQNMKIQDKLRSEIKTVIKEHDGKITYDAIKAMKYLDCVVQETLRKHPPLGFLNRKCTKNYKIPDSHVVIEKGTKIFISLLGMQNDPEYFNNPERFDPDRFSDENKESRTPFTHMPFGEGHRICIGERFGLFQTKVGIVSLISQFEFTLNPKTKLPFEFESASFVWSFKNSLWLDAKKI